MENETLKRELCNQLVRDGKVKEYDVVKHSYTQQIMDGNKKAIEKSGEMITLTTRGDCVGVCVKDSKLIGGFGTKGSTNQYRTQNRVYDSECCAPTINTGFNPNFEINGGGQMDKSNLRIRKLTPKTCFRLMGVKDEDFDKIKKNQSDASLYHLAGDSIVVNVLMAIFGEALDVDWKEHYDPKEWWEND